MASPPKPVERVMLETVAFHDPIDYHRLRRLAGERLHGEYSSSRHREALENLQELDLVERGGIGHEYVHLSDAGWSHLGERQPGTVMTPSRSMALCAMYARQTRWQKPVGEFS